MIRSQESKRLKAYRQGVKIYRQSVNNISSLIPEEEQELILRIQQGDGQARRRFAEAHLSLVVEVLDEEMGSLILDLIQEGNIALFTAIEKYKLRTDRSFKDFARPRIGEAVKIGMKKFKINGENKNR